MSPYDAQWLLRSDPRTAVVAEREVVLPPFHMAQDLHRTLRPMERVLALYYHGLGYAALTKKALILLSIGGVAPSRVARPLVIVRPPYEDASRVDASRVDVSVDGRRITLWGSRIDASCTLLQGPRKARSGSPAGDPRLAAAAGEVLPADSSAHPHGRARLSAWVRRRPVLASVAAAALVFAAWGAGHETPARAGIEDRSVVVPDFAGTALTTAVADARRQSWTTVSAADASSSLRPVADGALGWRVCFQTPSHDETVRPSASTLKLYAVPEKEACPSRLLAPPRVIMPDIVGERFDDASRTLDDLGLAHTTALHAHTGERLDDGSQDVDDWQVCRQEPEAGDEVLLSTSADLWLIGQGNSCTKPSPKPTPKPKPKPKPKPEPKPRTRGTSGSTTRGGTSGGDSGSSGSSGGSSGTSGGTTGGTGNQPGIQFGRSCSPVGATATTVDGRPAKCFMGSDGRARWGYNSG
ncbi:hypothetical protein [Streptomyces sp. NPDC059466]|uniref:hypothetical protein n=1 Tax=unclassified Streptomyces TaxID=2593676 RepID=UPI00368231A0